MKLSELSADQLRRAASIKDEIERLHGELTSILGTVTASATAPAGWRKKRRVSAATRAKMAAAQQKRWAVKRPTTVGAKPKAKRTMSAAAKKKLSDFHKARWAKIKAAKKK
jgi:hypothetical protein